MKSTRTGSVKSNDKGVATMRTAKFAWLSTAAAILVMAVAPAIATADEVANPSGPTNVVDMVGQIDQHPFFPLTDGFNQVFFKLRGRYRIQPPFDRNQ